MDKKFQENLRKELDSFLLTQAIFFSKEDMLKIDLHYHDYNSDVPDELIGRILRIPETWLSSERLLAELEKNKIRIHASLMVLYYSLYAFFFGR